MLNLEHVRYIGGKGYVPHWIAPCHTHSLSMVWQLTADMCVLGWIVKCFSTFGCPCLEALTGMSVCVFLVTAAYSISFECMHVPTRLDSCS